MVEFTIGKPKMWVVVRAYSGGRIEYNSAWFNEDNARERAGKLVSHEGPPVSLLTIDVEDTPMAVRK